ncbi:MAG TPA: alpha/beta hydrolase, partial [Methanobacterium sp.]
KGFTTGAIDLRGHGEHLLDLDKNILSDLETAISHFRYYGKVTAMGHSLGGRLSLISSADYAIGISPALGKTFSNETEGIIKELRDYRVHRSNCSIFQILNDLPSYQFKNEDAYVIYGSRDIPEVSSKCNKLKSTGLNVVQIEDALHSDIFLYEPTFETITKKLNEWYTA